MSENEFVITNLKNKGPGDISAFLSSIIQLDSSEFPHPWSESEWKSYLERTSSYFLIMQGPSLELAGFLALDINVVSQQAHLYKILVAQKFRRKGLSKRLVAHFIRNEVGCDNIYLEVSVLNTSAINLYNSLGFNNLVLKKKFYSDGSDAFAMQLYL